MIDKPSFRIGILGGAFDPVHNGHLAIAGTALRNYRLSRVIFVPAYCPPHKSRPVMAPYEHRLAMLQRAVDGLDGFEVSAIERKEACPSYAGTTVEELKQVCGREKTYFFITGLDAIATLTDRKKSRIYPGLCYFIVVLREGVSREETLRNVPEAYKPYVIFDDSSGPDISSSRIKDRLRSQRPISGLVPGSVEKYISDFGVYTRIFT